MNRQTFLFDPRATRSHVTPSRSASERRGLGQRAAFGLLASTALTLLAGSSAPTPLYATYQSRWGFSDAGVTLIFGVYAVAVLGSLLVFGSLSDHVGRRSLIAAALLIQTGVMVVFATASGFDVLILARGLQGLATGAALGAIGAGMVDIHPERGAVANAVASMAGTGTGAIGSALAVALLPAPTHLVYLILAGAFVVQAAGVALIGETSRRIPGARAALRPTLAVPPAVRPALIVAAPSLVAVWALVGFYGALGPSLTALISDSHSVVLGGASFALLAVGGGTTVLLWHRSDAVRFALVGTGLIVCGVAGVLVSLSAHSVAGFLAATAVAGAGFGAGFQGGLRAVIAPALPHQRAGVISVAYVISYLALGLPAILAGLLVAPLGLTETAQWFGLAVIGLAALTALGLMRSLRRRSAGARMPSTGALSECAGRSIRL